MNCTNFIMNSLNVIGSIGPVETFYLIGIGGLTIFVMGVLRIIGIMLSRRFSRAGILHRQAEMAEKNGNFLDAAKHYMELVILHASTQQEIPSDWLARLRSVCRKLNNGENVEEILMRQKAVVEIWQHDVSKFKWGNLRSALEELKAKIDTIPGLPNNASHPTGTKP